MKYFKNFFKGFGCFITLALMLNMFAMADVGATDTITMLNSIDYFNSVSGIFVTSLANAEGLETTIQFDTDVPSQTSYEKFSNDKVNMEAYFEKITLTTCDNLKRNIESIRSMALPADGIKPRIEIEKDGIKNYIYREEKTNLHYGAISIHSQDLTFGLLGDFSLWDIADYEIIQGRNCVKVTGKADEYYGTKLNMQSFILKVDIQTGIVIKFESFDSNNNLSQYLYTKELNIDSGTSVKKLSIEEYATYEIFDKADLNSDKNITPAEANTPRMSGTIDNDTIDSKYFNSRTGFPTYLTVNPNLYNGDARREVYNKYSSEYTWGLKTRFYDSRGGVLNVTWSVYLYDTYFTDTQARYGTLSGGGEMMFYLNSVNQNTAPAGWSKNRTFIL